MSILLAAAIGGSAALAAPDVHVAYHGHVITHPGVTGRLAWSLAAREDARVRLHPELEAGGWVHPRNQLALFARGGMALAHRGAKGGAHDLFVHVGGQRSTWTVPTYVVDGDDEELGRPVLAGQWWGTLTAGIGLGRNAWFVRPQLTFRGPYFHGLGTDVALQIGMRLGGGA